MQFLFCRINIALIVTTSCWSLTWQYNIHLMILFDFSHIWSVATSDWMKVYVSNVSWSKKHINCMVTSFIRCSQMFENISTPINQRILIVFKDAPSKVLQNLFQQISIDLFWWFCWSFSAVFNLCHMWARQSKICPSITMINIVKIKASVHREKNKKYSGFLCLFLSLSPDYHHDQENISKIQMC